MDTCKVVRRGSTICWECFKSSFTLWLMKAFLKRLKMELAVSRTPCAGRSGLAQGKQKLFSAPVTMAHSQAERSLISTSSQKCLCTVSEVQHCQPPIAVHRQRTASAVPALPAFRS